MIKNAARLLSIPLCFTLISGCHKPPSVEERDEGLAKQAVAQIMLDGESLRFQNLSRHTKAGANDAEVSVCGEVNGKNSFGAYVGFHRFIVPIPSSKVDIDPGFATTLDDAHAKLVECTSNPINGSAEARKYCLEDFDRLNDEAMKQGVFEAYWQIYCRYPATQGH